MQFFIDNLAYIIICIIIFFSLLIIISMLNGGLNIDSKDKPIKKVVTIESMI